MLTLSTKNRSLRKTKNRKGSLSRADETYLTLANNSANATILNNAANGTGNVSAIVQPASQQSSHNHHHHPAGGSTALNYSNSTVSNISASNSRKSLISNPINFQHIQHLGPNDGKSVIINDSTVAAAAAAGLPPISTRIVNLSTLNNTVLASDQTSSINGANATTIVNKKSTSTSGFKHIAKNDISAPTNFRHVACGYDDFNSSRLKAAPSPSSSSSLSKNSLTGVAASPSQLSAVSDSTTNGVPAPINPIQSLSTSQLPHLQQMATTQSTTITTVKSSSLSSSSSSSSSILHSPNSPNLSNNNENNIATALGNTLRPDSVLYNSKSPSSQQK